MKNRRNRNNELIDALAISIVGLFGIGAVLVDRKIELELEKLNDKSIAAKNNLSFGSIELQVILANHEKYKIETCAALAAKDFEIATLKILMENKNV